MDTPQRIYLHAVKQLARLASLIFANIFDPNYKTSIGTFLIFACLWVFIISCFYTMYAFDMELTIKCCSIFGFVIQGLIKYGTAVFKPVGMQKFMYYVESIYASTNTNEPTEQRKILWNFATKFYQILKMGLILMTVTVTIFYIYSPYVYITKKERELVIPTVIIFIDPNNLLGYMVTAMFHWVILYIAFCGTCAADGVFITLCLHLYPMSQLIQHAVDTVNDLIDKVGDPMYEALLERCLRNFFLMHSEMYNFTNEFSEYYYMTCTLEIYTDGLMLIQLVYIILTITWIPAYFVFLVVLFKLFVYCAVGAIVEIVNERIIHAITLCKWYALPKDSQKKQVQMMLHASQLTANLEVGVETMNMVMFINVIKTIYTISMLLKESLE